MRRRTAVASKSPSGAGMAFRAAATGALLAVLGMVIFAVQNTAGADVHFLWLHWFPPVFAVILASFLVGTVVGGALVATRRRGRERRVVEAAAAAPPAGADLFGRPAQR